MKKIVNHFVHKVGHHCESSTMRDLFEFHGFPMSEAMAFGLDATMGFGFWDSASSISFIPDTYVPFFLGGKQDSISPKSLACRLLGITLRKQSFSNADKAWEESKIMLDQDKPLMLQIDLGFLPYFEEEGSIHFGGHFITLGGYDEDKGVAYIGESDREDFQEVSIEALKRGRSSEYGPKFMWPKNTQYSMMRRPDGKRPPLAAGVKLAIKEVVNNMLRPSINTIGIQGLKQFANSILNWEEKLQGTSKDSQGNEVSTARITFEFINGYIETWGTGGGAFRNLYKGFLEEILEHPDLKEGPRAWTAEEFKIIEESLPIIGDSAHNFTLIAETLLEAADKYKDDCLNHVSLGELYNIALYIHSKEEELFKKLSKIKL
jgi:hypothetical protein